MKNDVEFGVDLFDGKVQVALWDDGSESYWYLSPRVARKLARAIKATLKDATR